MAAGLTVDKNKLDDLARFFATTLAGAAVRLAERAALQIDGALTPSAVNDGLIDLLEKAGPYGQGNPQPRFAFPAHRVKFVKPVGTAHIRCMLEAGDGSRLDAVAFRAELSYGLCVGLVTGSSSTGTGDGAWCVLSTAGDRRLWRR